MIFLLMNKCDSYPLEQPAKCMEALDENPISGIIGNIPLSS